MMKKLTYDFKIGEHSGYILFDYSFDDTVDQLVVNPRTDELKRVSSEFGFELDKVPLGYNNLLLRMADKYVLVDAGIDREFGEVSLGLDELKIDPAEIDTIVITHSDRDHIGGILDEDGEISFPNAKYVMVEESRNYWETEESCSKLTKLNNWPDDRALFAWERYTKIKDSIVIVRSGEEFVPGLRLYPALGHRYDHSILRVESSGRVLMHIADALAHPLFMANREWFSSFDADPPRAVETKTRLLDKCAKEKCLVFASHFPFPGLGYVQKRDYRWIWHPVENA